MNGTKLLDCYFVRKICCWLAFNGYNAEQVVEGADLLDGLLSGDTGKLPIQTQISVIERVNQLASDDRLWMSIGRYIGIKSPGMIGSAVRSSRNVEVALETYVRYFGVEGVISVLELRKTPKYSEILFSARKELGEAKVYFELLFGLSTMYLFRSVVGDEGLDTPGKAHDANHRLSDGLPIQNIARIFNENNLSHISFRFNTKQSSIRFRCDVLSWCIDTYDPVKCAAMIHAIQSRKLYDAPDSIITSIRNLVLSHPNMSPSQEEAALKLNLTSRTLRRKLKYCDIKYQDILNDVKKEEAIKMLAFSNMYIYKIAEKLGFNSVSAFRKAFRKWTGRSFEFYRQGNWV
ncbi:AraC family transcriptional regulator [Hahella ganghwensis]|uniref:AraC family transcriptional regulator n=1 Tax=Hahella ganghwensis TaxID=286420 RepID=UPI000373238A|nr:AraC family transcriptional regulator [Hahella ganghwensis]